MASEIDAALVIWEREGGPFANEEVVGEALAPVRDQVVIATKGLLLSLWSVQALTTLAFATGGLDLSTSLAAAGAPLIVGLCAALPAARRAARTDPLTALRAD